MRRPQLFLVVGFGLLLLTAMIELAMHRLPISKSHQIHLWAAVSSPELSQQIADAYSFSHIIHGLVFYLLFRLIRRRRNWPVSIGFVLAMLVECSWEILENTPWIIERYRRSALAAGYYGDTILNSSFDILFCALGFYLAAKLPAWISISIVVGIELVLALAIRDNLMLNILNLIHPFDSIKHWQSGRGF